MPASRRRPTTVPAEHLARVLARLADVEDRLRRLERRAGAAKAPGKASRTVKRAPAEGPRCPGCTLVLPRGQRGDTCAWCGFLLTAVPRRRPARRKR